MITTSSIGALLTIVVIVAASIMITITITAQQAHAVAVPLIKINTGDKAQDKLIQKFYNCFLKFSHPDPTGPQVKKCYVKTFGGLTN
jgi:hypothetical protein